MLYRLDNRIVKVFVPQASEVTDRPGLWGVRAVRPNRALYAKGPDPRYVSRYSIFVLWPQPPKLEPSKLERHVRGCQFVLPHVDSANWLPHRRLRVLHFRRADATAFFPAATCDLRLCETARARWCVGIACSRQQLEPATGRRPTLSSRSAYVRTQRR